MKLYDYHKREHHNSWILKHCEVLIEEAKKNFNSSLVLYAALEARNLLEKTEYDVLLCFSDKEDWGYIKETAKMKNGLDTLNKKYKALNYRYQTFSETFLKVISNSELKTFDYSNSGILQSKLSQYLHIYTLSANELEFKSDFIQNGIIVVNEAIDFIKKYYIKKDEKLTFGIIDFSTLEGSIKVEFDNWKKSASFDTDALFEKLKKINDEENSGKKYTF
jgi:hypothetical protein